MNNSYISIKGNSLGTDTIVLNSDSDLTTQLTARVYDPHIFDDGSGLLIAYVDQFDHKWYCKGTGSTMYGRFSHPKVPDETKYEGFHTLGSLARGDWTNPNGVDYGIIVKDKHNASLLAKPVDYLWIWSDWGSGGDQDGSFWLPVAPEGYVAMGIVAQSGYSKPSLDAIRCVKAELTVQGNRGNLIYNDKGSGADYDFSAYKINEPDHIASADGKAFFHTNTFIAAGNYDANNVNLTIANLLYITLPVIESADEQTEPFLTGYHPYENLQPRFYKSLLVPFTMLKDDTRTLAWKVANSPFYQVMRVETYLSLDYFDNRQGSADVTKTISYTTGFSETITETFSQELGIKISVGGSVGFLGSGGEWSVEVSTTFKWETSTAKTYSEITTKTTEYTVPSGRFVEMLQVVGSFLVLTGNGFTVGELPMKSTGLKILEYPLGDRGLFGRGGVLGLNGFPVLLSIAAIAVVASYVKIKVRKN